MLETCRVTIDNVTVLTNKSSRTRVDCSCHGDRFSARATPPPVTSELTLTPDPPPAPDASTAPAAPCRLQPATTPRSVIVDAEPCNRQPRPRSYLIELRRHHLGDIYYSIILYNYLTLHATLPFGWQILTNQGTYIFFETFHRSGKALLLVLTNFEIPRLFPCVNKTGGFGCIKYL